MLKIYIVGLFLYFTFDSFSQAMSISPGICDSISESNYRIHIKGYGSFDETMTLFVELISLTESNEILYSGSKNFQYVDSSFDQFMYDEESEEFEIVLGGFQSKNFKVHIWSEIAGTINEELYLSTNQ